MNLTITLLLILHGLAGVALLGALTHQSLSMAAAVRGPRSSFTARYLRVDPRAFSGAVVVLFAANIVLGALIYPTYRVDVRIPFEEMALGWAIGLFEMKEHAGGIGLGLLPLYLFLWRGEFADSHRLDKLIVTILLAAITWFDFIVGHVLNNIRGLA